jgi:uncharacterized protein (TIGR04222 family)
MLGDSSLTKRERVDLTAFLDAHREQGGLDIFTLEGFLCAVACGPSAVNPSIWLAFVFGEGPPRITSRLPRYRGRSRRYWHERMLDSAADAQFGRRRCVRSRNFEPEGGYRRTMSSAEFLTAYGVGCAALLLFAWWFVVSADDSADSGRAPLPPTFDPEEIAFLRGDANELLRFTVFDLMRSGYLEWSPAESKSEMQVRAANGEATSRGVKREPTSRGAKGERTIARTMTVPERSSLGVVGGLVYDFFVQPQTASSLFASGLPKLVGQQCAGRREGLVAQRLLNGPQVRRASRLARIVGSIAILGVGASRVAYAVSLHHRNIGFTVLMALVAVVLLLVVTRVPRLSKRGRLYVATLRAALPPSRSLATATLSPAFAAVVAAGGMAVLAGTPYAALGQSFTRQAASSSGSCSGGCGSGGGSSSSCSGGSGCGGGGCGGGD